MVNLAPAALDRLRTLRAGRRNRLRLVGLVFVALVLLVSLLSMSKGAVTIPSGHVVDILLARLGSEADVGTAREALIVLQIRLPRLLLGLLVGAALAVAGAFMQGLFRNPLADPGLVGVSAGAGLAAAAIIVLADRWLVAWVDAAAFALLPAAAFVGALASTGLLYLIATRQGRTSMATMLLAGIALGALASSLAGLLTYVSDDRQLRDLAFWSLGSLGGASWAKVSVVAPIILPLPLAAPFLARGLNALVLGEAEAYHLGIAVQRLKTMIVVLVAAAVGASVAATGIISFVGIVVPHLLRLLIGPDHRALLPLCAIAGASLLAGADIFARTLVAPAELPIGILTAALGAPFFLWLLLRRDRSLDA